MSDCGEILDIVVYVIGEKGWGMACQEAMVFKEKDGWYFMLEGFMQPWHLGHTLAEAKASIREYARIGFGLT